MISCEQRVDEGDGNELHKHMDTIKSTTVSVTNTAEMIFHISSSSSGSCVVVISVDITIVDDITIVSVLLVSIELSIAI